MADDETALDTFELASEDVSAEDIAADETTDDESTEAATEESIEDSLCELTADEMSDEACVEIVAEDTDEFTGASLAASELIATEDCASDCAELENDETSARLELDSTFAIEDAGALDCTGAIDATLDETTIVGALEAMSILPIELAGSSADDVAVGDEETSSADVLVGIELATVVSRLERDAGLSLDSLATLLATLLAIMARDEAEETV